MKAKTPTHLPGSASDTRPARKRYSFRLPVELASRLEALFEMHPKKTRAQITGDLLRLGLIELERAWTPTTSDLPEFHADTEQPIYLLNGPFSEFRGLIYKHHLALEHELDKDNPKPSNSADEYTLGDLE